jgi:hypothetical protein
MGLHNPSDWFFENCTFRNITQLGPSSSALVEFLTSVKMTIQFYNVVVSDISAVKLTGGCMYMVGSSETSMRMENMTVRNLNVSNTNVGFLYLYGTYMKTFQIWNVSVSFCELGLNGGAVVCFFIFIFFILIFFFAVCSVQYFNKQS